MQPSATYASRNLRLFIALFMGLSLGACSSLTNPYIDEAKLSNDSSVNSCPPDTATLAGALECSRQLKSRYLEAMGDQANLASWTGIGLIPLTAYTIGFAVNGESAAKISDFALTSAGLYSLSNWLAAPQRSKVYALGLKGLQCAEHAVLPLTLTTAELNSLQNHTVALDLAYADARSALAKFPDHSLAPQVQQHLQEANTLRQQAALRQRQSSRAAASLVVTARGINTAVNEALVDSVQSLSALPGFLSGLSSLYDQNLTGFSAYVPTTTDQGAVVDGLAPQSQRGQELADKHKELLAKMALLESELTKLTPQSQGQSLEQCGLDSNALAAGISLTPSTLSFNKVDSAHSVSISGGSGSYVYSANEDVFEVKQVPAFGDNLTIKLKSADQPGSYMIKVKDSSGKAQNLVITVSPPQPPQPLADGAPAVPIKPSCALSNNLQPGEEPYCQDKNLTIQLQTALNNGLPAAQQIQVDGDYGEATRKAALAYMQQHSFAEPQINELNLQRIISSLDGMALPGRL